MGMTIGAAGPPRLETMPLIVPAMDMPTELMAVISIVHTSNQLDSHGPLWVGSVVLTRVVN
jgi:hypothetical protein